MKILVINAGSSSLKYQLIDMETEQVMAKGLCERIGIDGHLKHSPLVGGKPVYNEDIPLPTHSEAIAAVIDKLTSREHGVVSSMKEIDAVGHRVVHVGGHHQVSRSVNLATDICITCASLDLGHLEGREDGVTAKQVVVMQSIARKGICGPLSVV